MADRQHAVTAEQLIRILRRMDPDKFVWMGYVEGYCCDAEETEFNTENGPVREIRLHCTPKSKR